MPRATCRCGQLLSLPDDGPDRLVCPKCGAKVRIRVRRDETSPDGYLRFFCACGRRLKVPAADPPSHGKCPDCGRVVPVPPASSGGRPSRSPDSDTVDLSPRQLSALEAWAAGHGVQPPGIDQADDRSDTPPVVLVPRASATSDRAEAGFRVCPNCRKPVHLGADSCRACGTPVPRK